MDNRGSAMLTAIVAGVVMSAFALSLIMVSYTLYAQTAKRTAMIQCNYLAEEVCSEIADELINKKSDMYERLNEQIYRTRPDGSASGIWAPRGNNTSVYFDTLEYEIDTKSADEGLKGYRVLVDFSYILRDAGTDMDSALPDDIYDETNAPIDDGWYEMDEASAAYTGNATVYIKVTCKKGDELYTVKKSVNVEFD